MARGPTTSRGDLMLKLVIVIFLSGLKATAVGLVAHYLLSLAMASFPLSVTLWLGLTFSVLIPTTFFFIRRWDGCIERLGAATFTGLILLSALAPLCLIKDYLPLDFVTQLQHLSVILALQMIAIGWVCFATLRSQLYTPPKPGTPWRW